ncbi:hypothetical protein A6302_04532 [Methylobrevis pamukkalensis]|uniref:Uncharacterized protein n=1 Tax=Methylobrevis pamukkalensis TaxID=1439726 RepID=A0A1E3GN33_9HYPH|nr:hypothetical protein A6302_04532 [Methylobrevis pamukkalensis]
MSPGVRLAGSPTSRAATAVPCLREEGVSSAPRRGITSRRAPSSASWLALTPVSTMPMRMSAAQADMARAGKATERGAAHSGPSQVAQPGR